MRKSLRKIHLYAFAWENYPLLFRTLKAAWLVRRHLRERTPSPHFGAAVQAVNLLYLPPQPGWHVSDPERIARFASFVINFPVTWGKCVHQSLITYRLLNGYGIPAKVCFGVNQQTPETDGHAWVVTLTEPKQAFAESQDPLQRFKLIYTSPLPES